jgi:rhamnose utilization protein RhaD (predicted bifunctional aldolase and dehydrogenase)
MADLTGLSSVTASPDRWQAELVPKATLAALAYRSRLLGSDRSLANQGGGNTSAKETTVDHAGRDVHVMWVKGSGTDLATITEAGFAGLRMDDLLPLRALGEMDDAAMVEYLLRSAIRPGQPRPSIETLLHAFIQADHVDHTHPDAIIALSCRGREFAQDVFGTEMVWLDYQRPGFDMSRQIALLLDSNPKARAVVLDRHGLVTWGDSGEASYRTTLEFVARAAEAITAAGTGRFGLGGPAAAEYDERAARTLLIDSLPALRGALLADADGIVLEIDRSAEAVTFASSVSVSEVS